MEHLKPSSDEEIAIKKLHAAMKQEFHVMGIQLMRTERILLYHAEKLHYREVVTLKFKGLFELFVSVTDPDSASKSDRETFVDMCRRRQVLVKYS